MKLILEFANYICTTGVCMFWCIEIGYVFVPEGGETWHMAIEMRMGGVGERGAGI